MKTISLLIFIVLSLSFAAHAVDETVVCQFSQKYFAEKYNLGIDCEQKGYLHFCHIPGGATGKGVCQKRDKKKKKYALRNNRFSIAGFNVFNLEKSMDFQRNKETLFKSIPLLAQVVNHWDLVSAIELKHLSDDDWNFNQEYTKRLGDNEDLLVLPGYLKLLVELHQLGDVVGDEYVNNWTLILSKHLHAWKPNDYHNNELAGFYYRSDRVTPVPTHYCGEDVACIAGPEEFPAELARKPFLGSFQAGKKDFTYIGVHIRFRYPTIDGVLDWNRYKEQIDVFNVNQLFAGQRELERLNRSDETIAALKLELGPVQKNLKSLKRKQKKLAKKGEELSAEEVNELEKLVLKEEDLKEQIKFARNDVRNIKKKVLTGAEEDRLQDTSRFAEVKMVADFIGRLLNDKENEEKDILWYGDFNLPAPSKEDKAYSKYQQGWHGTFDKAGALANFSAADTVINGKTSLGKKDLVSRYDHFVFDQSKFVGCNSSELKEWPNRGVFDFTQESVFPAITPFLDNIQEHRNYVLGRLKSEYRMCKKDMVERIFYDCGDELIPQYTEGSIKYIMRGFDQRLVDKTKGSLTIYKELISDHLPIFLTCDTNAI